MSKTQQELIQEEQQVLDDLINELDQVLLRINKKYTYSSLQALKAKEKSLPDTYGELLSANYDMQEAFREKKKLNRVRNELYDTRIIVDCEDDYSIEEKEIKIGLHTYSRLDKLYVVSWVMPVCRNYILDNFKEEYDGVVEKGGIKHKTHFKLKMKRRVDMFFDRVREVSHLYPLTDEEAEEIIADEFLKELLSRRSEQEFRNIVFSIQRHQGEIIQTPFRQNMIIQGCAGSGKSMIMLHRLPILLYDNPITLNRANLYIISPSTTYIQMAERMRLELEIADLKMGTLNQYWDHVIKKYGRSPEEYGKNEAYESLSNNVFTYVYSNECINDIQNNISDILNENEVDYRTGFTIFPTVERVKIDGTPVEILRKRTVQAQQIINKNKDSLQEYLSVVRPLFSKIESISRMLSLRKQVLLRRINQDISFEEKSITDRLKKLEKYDESEHPRMFANARKAIELANKSIAERRTLIKAIENNDKYFERLGLEAEKINKLMAAYGVERDGKTITVSSLYKVIDNRSELLNALRNMVINVRGINDPYNGYGEDISNEVRGIIPLMKDVRSINVPILPYEYLHELSGKVLGLQQINDHVVSIIYNAMMKRIEAPKDKEDNYKALSCSPYLFLQTLYQLQGKPNSAYESLISIDEAQNLSILELQLIKNVNGGNLVLNLYGDVNQHVEGSKGIDSWDELHNLASFKIEYMKENYRNARQITVYCNNRFQMDMVPINLGGSGVRQFRSNEDFGKQVRSLLLEPMSLGTSCIIVKSVEEAALVEKHAGSLVNRINDITVELRELVPNKWNLLTIDQAKGLEFENVFVLSGAMTKNEQYIAYTRALDKLVIYDTVIPVVEDDDKVQPPVEDKKEKTVKKADRPVRKKREKTTVKTPEPKNVDKTSASAKIGTKENKPKKKVSIAINKDLSNKGYFDNAHKLPITLKDYFEKRGLEVVDMRAKKGCLWVVGTKEEIGEIVKKAVNKFGVSGAYAEAAKAIGYRPGWYTKSAK